MKDSINRVLLSWENLVQLTGVWTTAGSHGFACTNANTDVIESLVFKMTWMETHTK